MKTYLEVFKACELKIESELMRLRLLWKDAPLLSRCNSIIQSSLFISKYQFLNCYLSYFSPAISKNEDGIEVGIYCSQKVLEEKGSKVYSSRIIYNEMGDVIMGNKFYISSEICSTNGRIIFENIDFEIFVSNPEKLLFDCNLTIDKIMSSFQSQLELIERSLVSLEHGA